MILYSYHHIVLEILDEETLDAVVHSLRVVLRVEHASAPVVLLVVVLEENVFVERPVLSEDFTPRIRRVRLQISLCRLQIELLVLLSRIQCALMICRLGVARVRYLFRAFEVVLYPRISKNVKNARKNFAAALLARPRGIRRLSLEALQRRVFLRLEAQLALDLPELQRGQLPAEHLPVWILTMFLPELDQLLPLLLRPAIVPADLVVLVLVHRRPNDLRYGLPIRGVPVVDRVLDEVLSELDLVLCEARHLVCGVGESKARCS